MHVRSWWAWLVVLWEIGVVCVSHPHEVWVPWEMVLCDPSAATLCATPVQIACHRIGILLTLTFLGGLNPFDRVTLRLDTNAPGVLEDDHGGNGPDHQEGCDTPHR